MHERTSSAALAARLWTNNDDCNDLLGTGFDYHDPCREAATALRRPFFGLPRGILLSEDGIHCFRYESVCDLVTIDELIRKLFLETLLDTTPWYAVLSKFFEELLI